MKHTLILLILLITTGFGYATTFDGVQQLISRRVPWLSKQVKFKEKKTSEGSSFTLHTQNNKLVIEASDANAAAVGLNWYLKNYCHRSMSHLGDHLAPVAKLPVVSKPLTIHTNSECRYALNYCTYNYTMSFYTWEDWQWEIDWMALNGVNLMLVANGSEAVWQNTLRQLGYSEKEINDFITGPAYNAWWLMGNIEGWGGPMPQSQIDSRKQLVQKMLKQMRSLGIEPLMPGFYGMVPSSFKQKTKAHVITQGTWGAFTRPDILDPTDPEFERVAAIFYQETAKLYGNDIRFFSGDPFHEGGTTEGVSLGDAGRAIQQTMQKHFPGSTWVLQGWQDNPKPGLLEKLDKKYILVQELFGENTHNWETRKGYEGTPFIWATVTNFGERPGPNGKLQRFADEVYRAAHSPYADYYKGVGVIPEGINNNPVTYELLLELPWHTDKVIVKDWINHYIHARYGTDNVYTKEAWQHFLHSIYSSEIGYQEGPPENILCARPSTEIKSVSSWGRTAKKYDRKLFSEGVRQLARALPELKDVNTYRIDLINFLRQVIANEADEVFERLNKAISMNNQEVFEREAALFLSMHDLEDELLRQDKFFRLSTWQQQALDAGNTALEKKNNLHNLMMLITYWGENNPKEDYLHDYAYKEWAGLLNTYYKERWEVYFNCARQQMRNEPVTPIDYFHWERNWANAQNKVVDDAPYSTLEDVSRKVLMLAGYTEKQLLD